MKLPENQPACRSRLVPILFVLLLSLCATGCSTPESVDDPDVAEDTAPARPGADRWQAHALELPANSPVVFWARSDGLLEGLAGLRDWIFAEPAMFGADGDQMIAAARQQWGEVIASLGMDPLAAASWQKMGLDTSREAYLGLYPVETGGGDAFVEAYEKTLREELELSEDVDLMTSISTMTLLARGDLPSGLHSAVESAVGDEDPILGLRAVVPVSDREAFLDSVTKMMVGAEFRQVSLAETADEKTRIFFYDIDGSWPGVMLRAGDELAVFDMINRSTSRQTSLGPKQTEKSARETIRKRLEAAIGSVGTGRPAAPKPLGSPVAGVAVDQQGTEGYAKLRGYRLALEHAAMAGVGARDGIFLENTLFTLRSSHNWAIASDKLTGVTYNIFAGEDADGYFRLNVTLFGVQPKSPLSASSPALGLGVDSRGLGMSLDLLPITDPAWQSFIGVERPEDVVDGFSSSDFAPGLFALSFPRSLAVLFANVEKIFDDRVPEWLKPVVEGSEAFRRMEIASAGIDMRGLRVRPRMVGLVVLDEKTSVQKRQELADAVGQALINRIASLDAAAQGGEEVSIPAGKLVELHKAPDASPALYYFGESEGVPFLFFSYGLTKGASQKELAAVSEADQSEGRSSHTFFARAEPVALFSLLTVFDPNLFDPLDVSILTQRLGGLRFSVEPKVVGGVQTIHYDFILERPPMLDGE